MDPLRSEADLIVYLDVKSPYAYLSIDPTRKLIREFGISIDWRPLTLNIPSFLGSAKADSTGQVVESNRTPRQWQSVRYAYMDVKRYARRRDILLYGPRKIWDTSLVHMSWMYVQERDLEKFDTYIDEIFLRFWKRELDVEDAQVLQDVMDSIQIDSAGFADYADGSGRESHDEFQGKLHGSGIFGVPTYVINQEVFFGREHLPMVRWILGGKLGSPPDIEYSLD
ncbi:MAG: DsbA family protein [Gammaproteobacteria bacterium]|nr:DsbA family protein [Gammaproteobacteria bacterium]